MNRQITERVRGQLRFETFNSLNTPEFNNPRDEVGRSGYGVVNAGKSDAEMQLGLHSSLVVRRSFDSG